MSTKISIHQLNLDELNTYYRGYSNSINVLYTTGDQTINGRKNFSLPPRVYSNPTEENDVVTKSWVEQNVTGLNNKTALTFWLDYGSSSGTYLQEQWTNGSFYITGCVVGVSQYGSGQNLAGSIYRRDNINNITNLTSFNLNTNTYVNSIGGLSILVSGSSRVGISITTPFLSGGNGLSIGLMGYLASN